MCFCLSKFGVFGYFLCPKMEALTQKVKIWQMVSSNFPGVRKNLATLVVRNSLSLASVT